MSVDSVTRRRFLTYGAAGVAVLASGGIGPAHAASPTNARRTTRLPDPFTLGVASGDPTPGGFVLWTRLAPDPLNGGGLSNQIVPVQWQVATDGRFKKIVARGSQDAVPELGHSIHVEVGSLDPGRWYWYRFKADGSISPVGRTRTAPAISATLDRMAFAVTSCQSFSAGYFTALGHLAREDLDLVVQLGDAIYEDGPNPYTVRLHEGAGEPVTLTGYRNRHAQYKRDPELQAAHAAFPWVVALDDHEVDNNWADEVPQDPQVQSREAFLARRAAAFQAYYEHMPLRRSSLPKGIDMQLYRRLRFGDLLDVHVLDTRQYRSDQDTARRLDPGRTILGDEQERWLLANLAGDTARWNVLAQQVFFSQRDVASGSTATFSNDSWDGYAAERNALRDHIAAVGSSNPVVVTGDAHCSYVCDVKADFDDPSSATVATELVGTSMTSGGDGVDQAAGDIMMLGENPHFRFVNRKRGYLRNVVTPSGWTADFRIVDQVTTPGAPIQTRASFVIEDGRPGAVPA